MGRQSKIAGHPKKDEIISRLVSGEGYSDIVRDFPDITWDDLDYFSKKKLPVFLAKSGKLQQIAREIETADIHQGDSYLQLVLGLQRSALGALELQDPKADPRSWAIISREARGYLELLGRALDRIKDQPQITLTQISIYQSPEWLEVGRVLADELAGYPELKGRIAARLLALQEARR